MTDNPLSDYFRTPKVHQVLPTRGAFFQPGDIETAINGELAIYPMTAVDEIILKNPDSLLNGDALERLFKSCVPGIKKPREISVPDMDVLLLAIKLASFGDALDISVTCPECKGDFETETSIRGLLSEVQHTVVENTMVRISDDMVIKIKPYDFQSKTILDMSTFEETKMYQYLLDETMDEAKKQSMFNQAFARMAELNLDLIARSIVSITSPKGEVTNAQHIADYMKNTDRMVTKSISDKLKLLSENGIPKELQVKCPNEKCHHEWKTTMVFDPAHFFV